MTQIASEMPGKLGDYELQDEIGRGPLCTVWRGRRLTDGNIFALKVLEPRYAENAGRATRFEDEARLAQSLAHPRIVRVHELVTHHESPLPFFVMDYIAGGNIARHCGAPRTALGMILRIILQACDAIGYIHERGLIHCDVKPTNILLDAQAQAFLTDFGMTASADELAAGGSRGGTIAYMSPEQFASLSPEEDSGSRVDTRSDIYSLGVVLYEVTTGELPFRGSNRFSLMFQRMNSEARPPREIRRDLPESLEQIILKAMARAPADRFQTVAELADALGGCRA